MHKLTDSQYQTFCSEMAANITIADYSNFDNLAMIGNISKTMMSSDSGLRNYLIDKGFPARYTHIYLTKDIFKYMPRI